MSSGIYKLSFKEFDKVYIGKSVNIHARTLKHINELQKGTHYNKALQAAYTKYGIPKIEVLEEVNESSDILNIKEIFWIKEYDSFNNGLNNTIGGDGSGYGEDSPTAKYSKETYVSIMELLAETDWTAEEIARELEVSKDIVAHISNGSSHTYLASEYPDTYTKMRTKYKRIGPAKYSKDVYIKILELLATTKMTQEQIAKELDVALGAVIGISAGSTHKELIKEYPDLYQKMKNKRVKQVLSPQGEVYTVTHAKNFAEEYNLSRGHLSQLLNGKLAQHKGWKLYNE